MLCYLAMVLPAALSADPDCIRGLVQLLSSNRASGQAAAAQALWRMAKHSPANGQRIAAEPGCLPALVQLLSANSVDVQKQALQAVWRLLQNLPGPSGTALIRALMRAAVTAAMVAGESGGIKVVVQLLGSERVDMQCLAAQVLSELALDSAGKSAILAQPACATALRKLWGSTNRDVQKAAVDALHRLGL